MARVYAGYAEQIRLHRRALLNKMLGKGGNAMEGWVDVVGGIAAVCTTFCWIPQTMQILREKRTEGISLITQSLFTFGVLLWAAYGLLLGRWPLLLANIITLVLSLAILTLKIRYR